MTTSPARPNPATPPMSLKTLNRSTTTPRLIIALTYWDETLSPLEFAANLVSFAEDLNQVITWDPDFRDTLPSLDDYVAAALIRHGSRETLTPIVHFSIDHERLNLTTWLHHRFTHTVPHLTESQLNHLISSVDQIASPDQLREAQDLIKLYINLHQL